MKEPEEFPALRGEADPPHVAKGEAEPAANTHNLIAGVAVTLGLRIPYRLLPYLKVSQVGVLLSDRTMAVFVFQHSTHSVARKSNLR